MDLTFFYPTRTRKNIKRVERYCSGSERNYLRKHVVKEKEGWYHVIECIGRKKTLHQINRYAIFFDTIS